jgi:O-antigen ligase
MLKFLFGLVLIFSGIFLTIFRDPVWGIYLFTVLCHVRLVQLSESYYLPLRIPILISVMTIITYVFSSKYQNKFSKLPVEVLLFGIMVIGMCLSSFTAKFSPAISWQHTFEYFKFLIFIILFIQLINNMEKVEWFHKTLILSSLWLVYRAYDLRWTTGGRFENLGGGYIQDANMFAAALVFLFPYVFHKILSKDKKVVIGAIVLCFGIVMAIILTVSRGGILGLIALFFILFKIYKQFRKKIVASAFVIIIVAAFFIDTYHIERFKTLLYMNESIDDSASYRLKYWNLALELFLKYPLTGIGFGNFPLYSGYLVDGLEYGAPGHVTHSLWFEMLSG